MKDFHRMKKNRKKPGATLSYSVRSTQFHPGTQFEWVYPDEKEMENAICYLDLLITDQMSNDRSQDDHTPAQLE